MKAPKSLGRVAATGVLCFCGWLAVMAQPTSPAPARIVTQYALTSTFEWLGNDPRAWRLLGSNDRGQTWTVLDVQTNQHFRKLQRRPFGISNRTPYNTYRLQIDRASRADSTGNERPSIHSDVQIAEIELIGPLAAGYAEEAVQPIVTASQEHPLTGLPENAFDGDPETRWRGVGVGKPGGCWIQCEYATESETAITNVSQMTVFARRAGTRDRLSQSGLRLLATLDGNGGGVARVLVGYALTSANDDPGRDPRNWRLLGSNDDGKSWQVLDERRDELFSRRFERRVFAVTNRAAYVLYRLEIHAVREPGHLLQIAELEPLFAGAAKERARTLVTEGYLENPPLETADQAFDGEPKTKWLSFTMSGLTNWLQWRCAPVEADLPVIRQRELDRLADAQFKARWLRGSGGDTTRVLHGYALTSANDYPDRDPRVWRLLGSNDGGKTWDVLDVRTNEVFGSRYERQEFRLGRPAAYRRFRLQIDEVAVPETANAVQLAEIEPLYAPADGGKATSMVVSAKGANGIWEAVDMAFDGTQDTKWLDYAEAATQFSSWVDWQYVTNCRAPVVNLDRLLQSRTTGPEKLSTRLEGVAVSWTPQSGELAFLDSTGFLPLLLDTNDVQVRILPQPSQTNRSGSGPDAVGGGVPTVPANAIRPGARLGLSGQVQFDGKWPRILHPRIEVTGWLPEEGRATSGTRPDSTPAFFMGVIEGRAKGVARGRYDTTLKLTDGTGGLAWAARVLNPAALHLPAWLDCPVRVRGVIEPLFDEQGRVASGNVWVAGPADVTFEPDGNPNSDASKQATNGPITEAEQVVKAISTWPRADYPVRIRGIITYIDMGLDEFYLQSGAHGFRVHNQPNAGLFPNLGQERSYVELRGLVRDGGVHCTDALTVLGRGELPQPQRHSWDYLMTGKADDQWVELEGLASAVQKQRLMLNVGGNPVITWVNDLDKELEKSLPGSLVRVAGICSPILNDRGQRLGLRLLTPSSDCIEVVNAVPKDPFSLPLVPIGRVLCAEEGASNPPARMVRTSGVITYRAPQLLFIQSGDDGLPVAPRAQVEATLGDQVEVAGVAQAEGFSPKLVEALVRRVGRGQLPVSRAVGPLTSEAANSGEYHDATRVVVEAILLAKRATETSQVLLLQQDGARQTFSAFVPVRPEEMADVPVGGRLRAVGVLKAKCDATPDFGQTVAAFEMYVPSVADITVLERPPWWTTRHTLWAMVGAAGVLVLALGWVVLLQRQVRATQLERSLAEARLLALRYQVNPHFLFNALNSAITLVRHEPARATPFLYRLADFLRVALRADRNLTVPLSEEVERLRAYLDVEKVRFEERLDVSLDFPAEFGQCEVPELILQPLVENAVKHGMRQPAKTYHLRLHARREGDHLQIEVANTGRLATGPDPGKGTGHTGLNNLRERLQLLYQERANLTLTEADGWVVARLSLPVLKRPPSANTQGVQLPEPITP